MACLSIHPPACLQVVVSTDVLARGVDLDRVNLVVNLDLPVSARVFNFFYLPVSARVGTNKA